ncbi:MAG: MarR family transcriptional regulator [Chitinophagaceae bacterium]
MGIEKDIHQNNFRNTKQKAIVNLLFTYGWLVEKIKNILSEYHITHQQFNILRILRGAAPHPLSTLQIRERMLDKMSDTSRIVDRMVTKDLVRKEISEKDKRLVDVTITEKGQSILKDLDASSNSIDDVVHHLSDKEAEMLSMLLDKLRQGE